MYHFVAKIEASKHDAFVKAHPLSNLLQSSAWAKVKDNWEHEIVGVMEDDELIASALVLIKKLPMHFTMMYIPRGPIMDYENERLIQFFFQELKKWAKSYHCLFVKMDPAISYADYKWQEEKQPYDHIDTILENLGKNNVKHLGFTMNMSDTIQPRFHANVYANDFAEENFTKSCRKMLKVARKKEVKVERFGIEKVHEFARIMQCTTKRKSVALRDEKYFTQLLSTYQDDAFLMMASLDLKAMYEKTKARYEENQIELKNCPAHAAKKRFTLEELHDSLQREMKELEENMKNDGEKVYIAGTLTVVFGKTSELLYAGMDDRYKRYMAPYITWMKTMEECFSLGCDWCNMGGIEGSLDGGLITFKKNYNPTINEFIGEFDFPVNRLLYQASKIAYQIRKNKGKK